MSATVIRSPFKGLAPFGDSDVDALLFFGRSRETETIAANLQAARLTVLFGPAGVGKTSVLRAGVAHRLRQEWGVGVEIVDSWSGDAVGMFRSAIEGHSDGELYLMLDQFEEYFVYHADDDALAAELADLLERTDVRVNVLVGIREDSLARLDAFKRHLPGLLGNRLRLDRLDRRAAEEAIRGPVSAYNGTDDPSAQVEIEPELVEAVLDEVAVGRVQLGGTGRGSVGNGRSPDRIEAPFLQLVLERLWDTEHDEGSSTLRLDTFRRLGGAASIVRDHLEHAMEALTPEEREAAAAMYHHLVTPSGTKIAHGIGDLAGYANVDQAQAAEVLSKLARERIVRGSSENGPATARYEIFHDVLADAVLAWRTRHSAEQALADVEVRRRRALRVAAGALIALMLVAAIAVFAIIERSSARTHERRAHAQELRARAGQLAAQASLDLGRNPQRSLELALRGARLGPNPGIEDVLRQALLASPLRRVIRGGQGGINDAIVSPDGHVIVTAGADGRARVYSAQGRLLHVLPHDAAVTDVAFNRNGTRIATASLDHTAAVWETASGRRLFLLRHPAPVTAVAFSPTGDRIATGSADTSARLWGARSGRLVAVLRNPKAVRDVLFSPSGQTALVVDHDRSARLFAASDGRLLGALPQSAAVNAAAFDPAGRFIATVSSDRTGVLWSGTTLRRVGRILGAYGPLEGVSFDHRGTLLATASADGVARVYSVNGLTRGFALRSGGRISQLVGHTHFVTSAQFSPDDKFVVTASSDGTARVWDVTTGRGVAVLAGHSNAVKSAVFSHDGRRVVTASLDGTTRIWDSGTGDQLKVLGRHRGPVSAAIFSPDGRLVASAGADHAVRIWNARTRKLVRTLVGPVGLTSVGFLGDSHVMTSGGRGLLWDVGTGRIVRSVFEVPAHLSLLAVGAQGLFAVAASTTIAFGSKLGSVMHLATATSPITSVAVGEKGSVLAAGSADGGVRVWRTSGAGAGTFHAHRGAVTALAFSPDGRILATGGKDALLKLWSATGGHLLHVLRGHTGGITSVAFSADGRFVVSGSLDADARVWSVADGRPIHRLHGHFGLVRSAEFSPDGRWIVTAGPATAGLWAASTGNFLAFLRGHRGALRTAVFGPDSRTILTAGDDGTIRTYDCEVCGTLAELVRLAERRLAQTAPR